MSPANDPSGSAVSWFDSKLISVTAVRSEKIPAGSDVSWF